MEAITKELAVKKSKFVVIAAFGVSLRCSGRTRSWRMRPRSRLSVSR
jgi:hypothetical protein